MTGPPEPARRLFFAFWPDAATREALAHASRKAVRSSGGRPVPPSKLHVTIAFLGSVAASRMAALEAVALRVTAAPLELVFDGIACWAKPQVLVATCSAPPLPATAIASQLWSGLVPLGIPADPRPFRPHVTLARKVRKPAPGLSLRPVSWPVTELVLVESVTDPAGARYEVLALWPLAGPAPVPPGSPPEPPAGPHLPPG